MGERWLRVGDDAPSLREKRGLDAIGGCDETIQRCVQMQRHELRIELESERIAERRLDHETAEIMGRSVFASVAAPAHCGRVRR